MHLDLDEGDGTTAADRTRLGDEVGLCRVEQEARLACGRLEALTLLERFDEGFQCKCARYVTGCVPAHAVGHRDGFFG